MARTVLQGRNALVLGMDTALGRTCAQQLSRSGCRVVLAGRNVKRLEELAEQLARKGGEPSIQPISSKPNDLYEAIRESRERLGHFHYVLNALAFDYETSEQRSRAEALALRADQEIAAQVLEHGPTKMLTLWPADRDTPPPVRPLAWHGHLILGPVQRLDAETPAQLDASGTLHLRAGSIGDSVAFLFQLPPSARPGRIHLEAIPSADRKGAV
jgi:hypothetical protein